MPVCLFGIGAVNGIADRRRKAFLFQKQLARIFFMMSIAGTSSLDKSWLRYAFRIFALEFVSPAVFDGITHDLRISCGSNKYQCPVPELLS